MENKSNISLGKIIILKSAQKNESRRGRGRQLVRLSVIYSIVQKGMKKTENKSMEIATMINI